MSNTQLVTTGIEPLTINSDKTFEVQAFLDGLPWPIAGGTANLLLKDPTGSITTLTGTISGSTATRNWTVIAPAGDWTMAWDITDASGVRQVSFPIAFKVISSP